MNRIEQEFTVKIWLAIALAWFIGWAVIMYSSDGVRQRTITINTEAGITCSLIKSTDGVAIDCWKTEE